MEKQLGVLGLSGNLETQKRLCHLLTGEKSHPAILVTGSTELEKRQLALGASKFLFCRKRGETFCGSCSSCSRIERGLHPDVWVVREEEEDTIKTETIRELCHQMAISPIEGNWKICLVENCERLHTAAANAFLKTLEEPGPKRVFFLLTNQKGSLPDTLLSRCLEFRLKNEESERPILNAEEESVVQKAFQEKDSKEILLRFKEKEDCVRLSHYFQKTLRNQVVGEKAFPWMGLSPERAEALFEKSIELESRLRSNASCALMVDGFLKNLSQESIWSGSWRKNRLD